MYVPVSLPPNWGNSADSGACILATSRTPSNARMHRARFACLPSQILAPLQITFGSWPPRIHTCHFVKTEFLPRCLCTGRSFCDTAIMWGEGSVQIPSDVIKMYRSILQSYLLDIRSKQTSDTEALGQLIKKFSLQSSVSS